MVYLLVRHTIEDYGRWHEGFDRHLAARQAGGATNEAYVMRNVDDAQEIIVLLGWHDLVSVRAFTKSVSLQTALKQMGVVGLPEMIVLKSMT
jgi:heme-degrading monooxygenase HmoA